jgi:hypothetical protein
LSIGRRDARSEDTRAESREALSDAGANALRAAGHNGGFTFEKISLESHGRSGKVGQGNG